MLGDVDQLLTADFDQVRAGVERLLLHRSADVAFSAELGCMPRKLTTRSFAHAQRARPDLSLTMDRPKHPFCLNSGGIVGRPEAIVSMLNRTCRPCQQGLSIDRIVDVYSRSYSSSLTGWIYSEQRELMKIYLSRPSEDSKWILDMEQTLWQANAGWGFLRRLDGTIDLMARPDGRIYNNRTNSISPFLHYNGDSKRQSERTPVSPSLVERRLRAAAVRRSRSLVRTTSFMQTFVQRRVAFVGPDLRRTRVQFSEICHAM